jgi:uncharacterized protein YaaW (UPF0174 family)
MDQLKQLLRQASSKERQALAEILGTKDASPDNIIDSFWKQSQSVFVYLGGRQPSWIKIVHQVADKLKVPYQQFETAKEVEIKIAQKVMETVWEKMTPEQRQQMEERLRETAQEFDKGKELIGSASIFAALTAAQMSGFGVYLLATTTLGALSGAIGVTLPFALYTTMTSTIATVIGPVGWLGAGLFAIWKLTGANFKMLVPAVVYICALRARIDGKIKH